MSQATSQGPPMWLASPYLNSLQGSSLAQPPEPSSFIDGVIQVGGESYQEKAGVRGAWGRLCAVPVLDRWVQVLAGGGVTL